jgi:hypothetical protein
MVGALAGGIENVADDERDVPAGHAVEMAAKDQVGRMRLLWADACGSGHDEKL